jgi:hypothetical protein
MRRVMRLAWTGIALSLVSLVTVAACGDSTILDHEPTSVRDRITADPTLLSVSTIESRGSLAVRWRTIDGWSDAVVDLSITAGDVVVSAEPDGARISIDGLDFDVASLDVTIGDGSPIALVDIHAGLIHAATGDASWMDDNAAGVSATAALFVDWAIEIDGRTQPLGQLRPPAMPLDVALIGDADHVDATLAITGAGTLWSWADLVELGDLSLTFSATTDDQK